jgi:hypothetical protein
MLSRWLPRRSLILPSCATILAMASAVGGAQAAVDPAEALLAGLHPDYAAYVRAVRPIASPSTPSESSVYMALVRPAAADPARRESAPFAGPGAKNDVLYDPAVLNGARSIGWVLLLLDHEYFHARHLAGATDMPLPLQSGAEIERHFLEAAAWGYTVSEARAGHYPGLREDEFREALDRYGDHYRALRELTQTDAPRLWTTLSDPLRGAIAAVRTAGSPPPAAPALPSAPDRSPATP